MRALWASAFLLRRLRGEVGVALIIFLLVAATAFLFGAGPRLFNRAADDSLRQAFSQGTMLQRNVQFSIVSEETSDQALVDARSVGDNLDGRLPDSLRRVVGGRALGFTSIRFALEPTEPLRWVNSFISFGYVEGLTDALSLVGGRLPESTGDIFPPAAYGFPGEGQPQELIPRIEVALSDETADELGVSLGDVVPARADGSDPMFPSFQALAQALRAEVQVVGIFTVTQPDAAAWYGDRSMQLVRFAGEEDNPRAYAIGLIAPTAMTDLVASNLPFRYDWRFLVDADRLDAGQVDGLLVDVQRLAAQFLTASVPSSTGQDPILSTGLIQLLRGYLDQRLASEAVLSVAAIGPLVLAAGAVGMVGVLLVSRRRATLALTRDRGATGLLLLGTQLWEATLLVGTAAFLGLAVAVMAVPGRANTASNLLALAVGGAAVAALVAATWPAARSQLGHLHAEQAPVVGVSPRRLVLEGTAVLLALGGIWLLRQRGLTIGGEEEVRFDPFLAATPALASVAVGIVAMRLYPFPIRVLGWLAARRRDLVPVLGLRTVGRHPAAANLPLLVLMLTAAFGAFASVVTSTVDRGQLTASWQNLGADYRIARVGGGPITRVVDPTAVDGVQAVAAGYLDPVAGFRSEPDQRSIITLYALDPTAYDAVTDGSPISADWPADMGAGAGESIGTAANPIPAIISRRLPAASRPLQPGSTFEVEVAGQLLTFVDAEERDAFPGLPTANTFVVAPFDLLQRAYANVTLQPTLLMVRGPADIGDELAATTRQQLPAAAVESRHEAYQALQEAPLVAAVSIGFRVALLAAAAYLALAVLAALTLTAAQRTRDLAFLRTLGVSARQALQLTLMEHGPPVVIALIPGVALGIAVAFLLGPALGLSAFAGTRAALELAVDWRAIALLAGGLLAVVLAAIGLSTWMARRAQTTDALRIGDD